jgi:hypothetical protein
MTEQKNSHDAPGVPVTCNLQLVTEVPERASRPPLLFP